MPIHDWTRVPAGILHDFHQSWCPRIKEALNDRLPPDYYALVEQDTAKPKDGRYGPDVLTLQTVSPEPADGQAAAADGGTALAAPPQTSVRATSDLEFYRRKKNVVTVRHVSRDRVVAVIELMSPGNKSGRLAFGKFLGKARGLLARRIHLLVVDLFPPSARDPHGIHAAIWAEVDSSPQPFDPAKPLTAASYECEGEAAVEGYVEPMAVGDPIPDMPVFLRPGGCVMVPLEATYTSAYATVPKRWRAVIEGSTTGGPTDADRAG